MFGGNSNWRGPVWFPMNYLLIESLQRYHHYYGDDCRRSPPDGSGRRQSILEVSEELGKRLINIFLRDANGPAARSSATTRSCRTTRTFGTYVLFYEYFHGDDGRGVGAAHQTGWTGLVAKLIQPRRKVEI
jgi:hypothetical protein